MARANDDSTKLLLIRHGQTVHNASGRIAGSTDSSLTSSLTLVGMAQAARLGAHVAASYPLAAIYASPLRRARLTAQRIADRTGHELRVHDDLREIGFGVLEGMRHADAVERFPGIFDQAARADNASFRWPGGESAAELVRRVRRVFDEIVSRHAGETVAVVAHGGIIGTWLADVVENAPHRWSAYAPANCSITEVTRLDDWTSVGSFNDCSFLVDDTPELARASVAAALADAGLD